MTCLSPWSRKGRLTWRKPWPCCCSFVNNHLTSEDAKPPENASKLEERMRHLWIFSWTIVSRSPAFMEKGATEGKRPPRSDMTREPTCGFPRACSTGIATGAANKGSLTALHFEEEHTGEGTAARPANAIGTPCPPAFLLEIVRSDLGLAQEPPAALSGSACAHKPAPAQDRGRQRCGCQKCTQRDRLQHACVWHSGLAPGKA
jgi:hypothetical protein